MSTSPRHIGKYELHERLGQGGTAEVWKALDPHLQRFVAIKMLHANLQSDPDFIKRFEREARAVASLRHPNIVQIHDFQVSASSGENNPTAYMVMEYVEGRTLTEYIRSTSSQGIFPSASEILHLFTAISSAVDYAHQRGILHRDIKPANILLDKRNPSSYQMGEPILTDFGIVKLLGTATGTLVGSWMGTPSYISPEQAQGHPCSERSDIYSLGVILYEICTGVRPFQGDSVFSIIWHHINNTPLSPALINPYISPALADTILRSLAKDPLARFQSCSEMVQTLSWALTGSLPQLSIHPSNTQNEQAAISPIHASPRSATAPSPVSQAPSGPLTPPPTVLSTPQFPVTQIPSGLNPMSHEQRGLLTPTGGTSSIHSTSTSTHNPNLSTRISTVTTALFRPLTTPNGRRRRPIFFLALLGILLVGSSLGTLYLLPKGPSPSLITDQIVGQGAFISTGQQSVNTSQGLNDRLHIMIHNVKNPAPGKSYYAWLLEDSQPVKPNSSLLCQRVITVPFIALGKLTVDHRQVDFTYPGDSQHSNLLGIISRLLITEEDANNPPLSPSPDKSTWRYHAELPQQLGTNNPNPLSALDDLRCLLYQVPSLYGLGIAGGLEIQFVTNTKRVMSTAEDASNAWSGNNIAAMQQDVLLTLEYLDGLRQIRIEVPGKTLPPPADRRAQIGLISLPNSFDSYYDTIESRLNEILVSPGVTPTMQQHGSRAKDALIKLHDMLQQVHDYALSLAKLSPIELSQPWTQDILRSMRRNAQDAYNGYIDPATGTSQPGILQIDQDIHGLANFEIRQL